jgi:hypothetical protein
MDEAMVLELTQPSARRRDYQLRRGGQVTGSLRFPRGRRSGALAEAEATGPFVLVGSRGRVEARGGPDGAATLATVERQRGGAAVIHLADGPALRWRRAGRRNRWVIDDGGASVLQFSAAHGLLRSSARITAHRELPEPTTVLLCLVGGFLSLTSLQADIDGAAAAVAGIAATGAG